MLRAYGAELQLTPGNEGMQGAIALAKELVEEIPAAYLLQQFDNPANPSVHAASTAEEIWQDTEGHLDALVAGVGTGGTITGCARVLRSRQKDLQVIAVEPSASPVLSGGEAGPHRIQGIGAGFVPPVFEQALIDEVIAIDDDEAMEAARSPARWRRDMSVYGVTTDFMMCLSSWALMMRRPKKTAAARCFCICRKTISARLWAVLPSITRP